MTMTMNEFDKMMKETYDKYFGDIMKKTEFAEGDRNKELDRLGKDIKPESKGQNH